MINRKPRFKFGRNRKTRQERFDFINFYVIYGGELFGLPHEAIEHTR